jgi:hypothetical protein
MRFRMIAVRKFSSLKRSCGAFRPIVRASGAVELRNGCLRKDMQGKADETERPRILAGHHRRQHGSETGISRISPALCAR